MSETAEVLKALAAVRDAVPYLKKDLTVGGGNWGYKAVGIEQIISAIRPKMAEHGLVIWPSSSEMIAEDFYTTNNKTLRRVTLRVGYIIAHSGTGQFVAATGVGEGADTGDKGIPKAMTGAYKSMLRQVLAIQSGDNDPDVHHSDELASKGKPGTKSTRAKKSETSGAAADKVEALAAAKATADMAGKIRTAIGTCADIESLEKMWKAAKARNSEFKFRDEQWLPIEAAYKELKEHMEVFDKVTK